MKKAVSILLCWVLLFALLSMNSAQSAALASGDFQYELSAEGTAAITRYTGSAAQPEIPAALDGHPVTQIGDNAFRDCAFLQKITLQEGVEAIGAQAFYNCAALSGLSLPMSLKVIGDLAFAYCASLQNVVLPGGVQSIGEYAFGDCSNLLTAAVPASVIQISPDAFLGVAAGFRLFGGEGSFAQEYAAANAIAFEVSEGETAEEEAGPETSEASNTSAEGLPPPAVDDMPAVATPGPILTAEITVRFPHADRTGTYTGEMKDGLAHGKGSFTTVNDEGVGWTYKGAWENGAMNGPGTLTWSDGLSFEGFYRDNQPYDGKWLIGGAAVYTGGFRMCPECGLSVFHGQGKLTNRLGRVIYEGMFEDGLLSETAQARQARAQALDPDCETLTNDGYLALLNAQDAGAGKLLRLEGRVGEVLTDDAHGEGEFFLLNNGSAAGPVHIRYRYGTGEERAQTGQRATVWGTVIGLYRDTDSRGRGRVMPELDADVIRLSEGQAQRGLTEVVITAFKALNGRPLKNREFTFALDETFTVIEERTNPLDGSVTFVPVTYANRLQTKANGRDGTVAFDLIRYTTADIGGVFTYAVTEIPSLEAGMVCDPMAMTVTVIVTDNGAGMPVATVFYPNDMTFDNFVQAAEFPLDLEVAVELAGRPLQEAEFTFQLLEGGEVLSVTSNFADGRVLFDPVMFSAADIGTTRLFTVRQVPTGLPGVTYDPMEVTFAVIAELDIRGQGAPMLTYDTPIDTAFNNVFAAQGEAGIAVSVTLEGREIKNGEFSFQLEDDTGVLQTKRSGRDGKVEFDPRPYTEAHAGKTFVYLVKQVPGTEPGMSYDTAAKGVSVQVSLDGGMLKADVTYLDGAVFTNRFVRQASLPVLTAVDADRTSLTAGESVTFTPRVSGGVPPYRYHYVLYRDGKEIKDIGWLEDAARRSQLSVPGVVRMKVEVQDANGSLTQAVMSTEVTVNQPAWTPMDLSGRWNISLVITGSSGEADTPVGTVFPMQIDVEMKNSSAGSANYYFEKFSGTPGTITYNNGSVTVAISNEWNNDTLKGTVEMKDGAVTMSGTYFEDSPKRNLTYTGTWTAVKAE